MYVDHLEDDVSLVGAHLRRAGYTTAIERVDTAAGMAAALAAGPWDLVLSDYSGPGFGALEALKLLQASRQDLPFIIVSAAIPEEEAVAALKAGAHDFVLNTSLDRLGPAIARELGEALGRQQRREARAALRAAEQRYRSLAEHVPAIVYIVAFGRERRTSYINPQVETLLGFTPAEWLADPERWEKQIHPDDRERVLAEVQRAEAAGQPLNIEYRLLTKAGQPRWFHDQTTVARDEAGRLQYAHGLLIDISQTKPAAIALAQERNLLRTLIDNIPDFIYAKDTASRFTLANTASASSLGHSPEEVVGKTDFDLHPSELAAQFLADEQAVMQSGQPLIDREEMVYENGLERWLLTSTVPLRDETGQIVGLVGVSRNITDRRQAEIQLKQRLSQLDGLRAIDQAISGSLDLRLTLAVVLEQVVAQLKVDATDVLLLDRNHQTLSYAAGRGFRSQALERTRTRLGEGRAGRAALERRVVTADLRQERAATRTGMLAADNFVSYVGVPLIAKGEVLGVLEVFQRSLLNPPPEWLDFLSALAGQAAIALDNAALFGNLQQSNTDLQLAYDATIEGWSRALDLRDKETEGHSRRVTELSERLAAAMGMSDQALVHLRRGALLHDIGKMGVPDQILSKPGPLTDDEWVIMRRHPALAYEMLAPIRYLRPALEIPYCHHEKWDGSGYPRGLAGNAIPLSARIFAVVDVWDALKSDRPYRPAWPAARVRAYLRDQAGTHFDPAVAAAFLEMTLP